MTKVQDKVHLGAGTLTWSRAERVSDRYGSVYLMADGNNSLNHSAPAPSLVRQGMVDRWTGFRGDLLAVVVANRESTHIGDLFRGVAPRKPEVGQIIKLGTGRLFSEPAPEGGYQVGVSPDVDDQTTDWLDIRALYDAHEQTVELFFHPNGA